MFRKRVETSVINSLGEDNSPYFAKKFQKYFEVEKIQLQFSKSGIFWKKKIKISPGSRKKSNFNFQNRGFFGEKNKKKFRKFIETSVILSL